MTRSKLNQQWLLPLVVSLHNLEEAIYLPRFWAGRGGHGFDASAFCVLAGLIAALAWVITYFSRRQGKASLAGRLFLVFCSIMLANALWHVAASVYLRCYAPGVVTAVCLVLPATSYLLLAARRADGFWERHSVGSQNSKGTRGGSPV